jgi:formylglycine-generating enzyme required for sulfatase activity
VNEQIRKIQEYIYARYVDPGPHGTLDEDAARRVLEEHYRRAENVHDAECCYLGILYFEQGFENDAKKVEYFREAKRWLDRYRSLSADAWDAVDDRMADIEAFFAEQGIREAPSAARTAAAPATPKAVPTLADAIDAHGPMVLVGGGEFLFGPDREVRVLPAFYVDKFPVTNRQYEAFCRATGYRWPKYYENPKFSGPEQPVVGVSAVDALKYCRWAGKTLPTEEQWEKAARGTDGRPYPWGEKPPENGMACFGRDPVEGGTDPVGAHPQNVSPFGAQELAGNVWEWTSTTVDMGEGVEAFQVVKGGCYNDPAELLRADARLDAGPKDKFETIGFRCIKPV